jgi:hypothetical protein
MIRRFLTERDPTGEKNRSAVGSCPMAAFRSRRALSFAVIVTPNLCIARLIRASYEGHCHIHDHDDTG